MNVQWSIIMCLLAIIPALVVGVVLFLRTEGVKYANDRIEAKVKAIEETHTRIMGQYQESNIKMSELNADVHGLRQMQVNTDESFRALTNKWNARERYDRTIKRKEAEDVDVNPNNEEEIPGTAQQNIPGLEGLIKSGAAIPLASKSPFPAALRQRKFGEIP